MDWRAYLTDVSKRLGLPAEFAFAIQAGENAAGDPSIIGAPNSNGTRDYGLFQLNSKGQGAGLTVPQMLDPKTNIDTGIVPISKAYKAGSDQGLVGYPLFKYTLDNSGHRSIDITHPGRSLSLYQQFISSIPTGFSPSSGNSEVPEGLPGPQAVTDAKAAAGVQNAKAAESGNALLDGATGFLSKVAAPFALALLLILIGGLMLGLGALHE